MSYELETWIKIPRHCLRLWKSLMYLIFKTGNEALLVFCVCFRISAMLLAFPLHKIAIKGLCQSYAVTYATSMRNGSWLVPVRWYYLKIHIRYPPRAVLWKRPYVPGSGWERRKSADRESMKSRLVQEISRKTRFFFSNFWATTASGHIVLALILTKN